MGRRIQPVDEKTVQIIDPAVEPMNVNWITSVASRGMSVQCLQHDNSSNPMNKK
ncbi:hypothetical protein DPMN_003840 [Dreissena polymorpha]|uniref:Uncharacterized protein n=1 Tax=Dreissena polymorpha TaxID=45954 RepID=A0A9D4RT05_DREPO|nr:hypothetical protein DPMN_003840 [Dreissena polymorpha]